MLTLMKTAGGPGDSENDPDNITIGIRAEGAIPLGESMKFIYEGDLAQQNDAADREADFTAGYGHFVAGLNFTELGLVAKAGYEYIGSNDGRGGLLSHSVPTTNSAVGLINSWLRQVLV